MALRAEFEALAAGEPPHISQQVETCPVGTEGGTRRVHLVREGGGGGGEGP